MIEYGLVEVSRISTSPMSMKEAKAHLRIIGNDADPDYIQTLIDTAEAMLEELTMIALRRKIYTVTFPSFATTQRNMQNLYLPRNPVISVDSFTMQDINNVPQTVTNSQLRSSMWPATLAPLAGQFWPLSKYRTMEAIKVTFTAGFLGNSTDPRFIKSKAAMRYLLSHMYENREFMIADSGAVPYALPYSLKELINSLRYGGFL